MKNKILYGLMASVFALSLVACGKKEEPATSTNTASVNATVSSQETATEEEVVDYLTYEYKDIYEGFKFELPYYEEDDFTFDTLELQKFVVVDDTRDPDIRYVVGCYSERSFKNSDWKSYKREKLSLGEVEDISTENVEMLRDKKAIYVLLAQHDDGGMYVLTFRRSDGSELGDVMADERIQKMLTRVKFEENIEDQFHGIQNLDKTITIPSIEDFYTFPDMDVTYRQVRMDNGVIYNNILVNDYELGYFGVEMLKSAEGDTIDMYVPNSHYELKTVAGRDMYVYFNYEDTWQLVFEKDGKIFHGIIHIDNNSIAEETMDGYVKAIIDNMVITVE